MGYQKDGGDESPNREILYTMKEAWVLIESWRD